MSEAAQEADKAETALQRVEGEAPQELTFEGLGLGQKTIEVLEEMAYKGMSLHTAAEKAGMRPYSFTRAFNRPHVRAVYNQIVANIRANAGMAAYLRLQDMSETAQSEHVRLEANKWVAGVDGISPLKRVEGKHTHNHSFAGFDYGEVAQDITPSPDKQSAGIEDAEPSE